METRGDGHPGHAAPGAHDRSGRRRGSYPDRAALSVHGTVLLGGRGRVLRKVYGTA